MPSLKKHFQSFLTEQLAYLLLGERLPLDLKRSDTEAVLVPAGRRITHKDLRRVAKHFAVFECDPSPIRNKMRAVIEKAVVDFAKKNRIRR